MKAYKKILVLGLVSLMGLTSMNTFASTPAVELVPAKKAASEHWAAESFMKAKEYGIRIPAEATVSYGKAWTHFMRTVSLVDTQKELDKISEETIKEAMDAAKEMGIETNFDDPVQVIADLNYETLKLMISSNNQTLKEVTRLELGKMLVDELKDLPIQTTRMMVTYSDMKEHDKDLEFLANARIMIGADGKFRPDDMVTKEELVCILVRVYEILERIA